MGIRKYSTSELVSRPLNEWGRGKALGDAPPSVITGKRLDVTLGSVDSWGIWEASPGTFVREVQAAEYMHILAGECTFTPESGTEMAISAGDCLFFPPNTRGVWRIIAPLRKVYALFQSQE